ncbi:NAD(+) diphosphatase [Actinotalea ferrariae]|uniref:NAD(+) diphosphatase n=1 Tax=Actinotalea ferrariae TaxID=1386098 RepID=UPI001C8C0C1D|nr:NAD(+) diphosphatase [Actinotalea ferrariae]MBX9246772.1 NAD(+) diphosphatase [Actinotalea ferrariae]
MDWTRLPLARAGVDRAAHLRTEPGLLDRLSADPTSRVVVVADGRLATRATPDGTVLHLLPPDEARATIADRPTGAEPPLALFLGADDEGAYLGWVVPEVPGGGVDLEGVPTGPPRPEGEAPDPDRGPTWSTLRDVGHALSDRDAGLAAAVVGLAAWHERHPRCPRCGAPTTPSSGGWTRTCTADGSDHYPRTDPAVIMAVVDDADRLLLGHAAHWPARRFSTLAGYVEPGESLESAVRREVHEEVGLVIGAVGYRGSQPWPFPASLMLAFVARARTTAIEVDGAEVTEARWFTREELGAAVASGDVLLPMRTSVARALIEDWFGAELAG